MVMLVNAYHEPGLCETPPKTNHLQEIVSKHSHFSTQYSVTILFAFPVIFSTLVLFTCWTSWMTILHKIGWIMIFSSSTHNTPEASATLAVIIKIICRLWKAFWVNRGKDIFLSILLVIATVANGDTIVSWPSSERRHAQNLSGLISMNICCSLRSSSEVEKKSLPISTCTPSVSALDQNLSIFSP